MSTEYLKQYIALESGSQAQFRSAVKDGCLKRLSPDSLINALVQRRFVALRFTLFCDTIMCGLADADLREVVQRIVKEEYLHSNHRDDFVRELALLGVTRQALHQWRISEITRRTAAEFIDLAEECTREGEVFSIVALRFCSEILAGLEFKFFFETLYHNGLAANSESPFLLAHVEYDLLGHEENNVSSHAEQYRPFLDKYLVSKDDLRNASAALKRSLKIRADFYTQFRTPDAPNDAVDDLAKPIS